MRIETLLIFLVVLCAGYGYPVGSRTKRKTIFIPPNFGVSCSNGYFLDESGDCVRVVQLDQQNYRVFLITEKLRGIEYEDDYEESSDEESYIAIQGPPLRLKDDLEKSGIEKRNSETSDKPEPVSTIILPLSSLKQLNAHDTLRNQEINKAIDDYNSTPGRRVSQKSSRRRLKKKLLRSHRPKMKLQLSFMRQKFNKSKSAHGESAHKIKSAKIKLTPTDASNLNQKVTTEKLADVADTTASSILTTTLLPLETSTYVEENRTEMETTTSETTTTPEITTTSDMTTTPAISTTFTTKKSSIKGRLRKKISRWLQRFLAGKLKTVLGSQKEKT